MTTQKYPKLKADKRQILGRKVKKLRVEGILPANLYGAKIKSQAIGIPLKEFNQIYKNVGETGIVELAIGDGQPKAVLIHNVQKDPVFGQPLHVDFRQVDLKQKITATVGVELIGKAPAENVGGILVQILNEVEVEALPTDLPEKITADVSNLAEINQSITVADLVYDKTKVTLKVDDPKALVAKIEPPAKEEVEVKPAEVPAEGEVAAEGKPEEGKPGEAKPEAAKEGAKPAEKPGSAKPEEKKEEKK